MLTDALRIMCCAHRSELGELPGVSQVKASLAHHSVEVTGDFGDSSSST